MKSKILNSMLLSATLLSLTATIDNKTAHADELDNSTEQTETIETTETVGTTVDSSEETTTEESETTEETVDSGSTDKKELQTNTKQEKLALTKENENEEWTTLTLQTNDFNNILNYSNSEFRAKMENDTLILQFRLNATENWTDCTVATDGQTYTTVAILDVANSLVDNYNSKINLADLKIDYTNKTVEIVKSNLNTPKGLFEEGFMPEQTVITGDTIYHNATNDEYMLVNNANLETTEITANKELQMYILNPNQQVYAFYVDNFNSKRFYLINKHTPNFNENRALSVSEWAEIGIKTSDYALTAEPVEFTTSEKTLEFQKRLADYFFSQNQNVIDSNQNSAKLVYELDENGDITLSLDNVFLLHENNANYITFALNDELKNNSAYKNNVEKNVVKSIKISRDNADYPEYACQINVEFEEDEIKIIFRPVDNIAPINVNARAGTMEEFYPATIDLTTLSDPSDPTDPEDPDDTEEVEEAEMPAPPSKQEEEKKEEKKEYPPLAKMGSNLSQIPAVVAGFLATCGTAILKKFKL